MIEGKRVRLWAVEKFDVARNYHWGNDPELIRLTGMNPYPKSTLDLERWFENICVNPNLKMFAIKTIEGEYIGNIEISEIDWRVGRGEIGLMIGEAAFRGQGYGSEAIRLLCEFAFGEMRFHRIEARVLVHNVRAQRTFESCGFVREGVARESFFLDGRWVDVVGYGLLPGEIRAPST
jgi:RimJ/RimL family protein N-acetyltransferase